MAYITRQLTITASVAAIEGMRLRFIMPGMDTPMESLAITRAEFVGRMAIPMQAPVRRARIIRRISLPVAEQTVTNRGTKIFRAGETWLNAAII